MITYPRLFFVISVLGLVLLSESTEGEPEKELEESMSNLTVRLLRVAPEGNVAFSPFCISVLLGVVQQGGGGNSSEEIGKLLGFGPETSKKYFKSLSKYVQGSLNEDVLHWGNRIYIRNDLEIDPDFQENVKTNFEVTVHKANFTKIDFAKDLNEWVGLVTEKRIEKVVEPTYAGAGTVLLLLSAVYFSDMWVDKFNVRDTEDDRFHVDDKTNVTVPFMIQKNRNITIGEDTNLGARWIRLGYSKAPTLSMLFILPTRRFGLEKLLEDLTETDVIRMMRETKTKMTTILIPKFKLSGQMKLQDYMRKLGVVEIFTDNANLTGMIKSEDSVQVSNMIQECRIEVNEKGTTAAAVASAKFQFLSGSMEYPDNAVFKADEPFLFIIFDKTIEIPLFAGKVTRPEDSSTEDQYGAKKEGKNFT